MSRLSWTSAGACRQIRNWGHTPEKAREIQALAAAWADYIVKKRGAANKLPDFSYLSEAEPFLAAYMQRGEAERRLVGSADVSTVGVTYGHVPAALADELEDHKDEVVQQGAAADTGKETGGGRPRKWNRSLHDLEDALVCQKRETVPILESRRIESSWCVARNNSCFVKFACPVTRLVTSLCHRQKHSKLFLHTGELHPDLCASCACRRQ